MNTAPEGPLFPVLCLHGPLQKLSGEVAFENLDLYVNMLGETSLQDFSLVDISTLKLFHFLPDQNMFWYM